MRIVPAPRLASLALATAVLLVAPTYAKSSQSFESPLDVPIHGAERKVIDFHGMRVRIGYAAARTRAFLRTHPNFVPPAHPLYVADPGLNAVVLYNVNGSGTQFPSAMLGGPNSALNGPDSITGGWDEPCSGGYDQAHCTSFIWVTNAGNNTVNAYTVPLVSANQAPYSSFYTPTTCSQPGLGFPAGIAHSGPTAAHNPGYLSISDEGTAAGAIEMYLPVTGGPLVANCPLKDDTGPPLTASSGLRALPQNALQQIEIINANATTVTREAYKINSNSFVTQQTWNVGGATPPNTQGTAADLSEPGGGYIWVTTTHSAFWSTDGVWLCTVNHFVAGTCSTSGPRITAGISSPVYPKASGQNHRLYVPNQTTGTVTSYPESGPFTAPYATYINLASPWDVAGVDD